MPMMSLGTQKAPSPKVVMPFYITAAIVFLILTVLLIVSSSSFLGHYFQPHILTITHLAALGWGTMLIFGASHQLLPVVMEVHLYSEKLAGWCYFLLLPGVIFLTTSFWFFATGWTMELGALLILSAVTLYVINVYQTAHRTERWTITTECIVTASWWLLLTAILGTLLVFNLRYAFFPKEHLYYLKIHAHLGMAGWFLLMIMGVASRLIPMFLLSHHEPGRAVKFSYYCVNAGLLGFLIMAFIFNTEKYWPVCALIVLAGVISYAIFVKRTFDKGVRTKKIDFPMKVTLAAIFIMFVPFLLLLVLVFLPGTSPDDITFSLAYGISVLGGFITAIMLGQTFKTLPFIVWMNRYKKLIGKTKIPLPRDLYKERIVSYQFYAYVVGYICLLAGVLLKIQPLITIGGFGLLLTAIFYNINVFTAVFHRVSQKQPETKNIAHGIIRN